mgnify:CR=1 FL=1
MARILTFSVPKEDDKLLEWLEQKSEESGLDKSNLVRRGLRLLMEREVKVASQLDRIEAKQERILEILEGMKGEE